MRRISHLLVQVGKEGSIYLIDRDKMGHFNSTDHRIVQDLENAIGGCGLRRRGGTTTLTSAVVGII